MVLLLFSAALAGTEASAQHAAAKLWRQLTVDPWSAASLDGPAWTMLQQPSFFPGEGEPWLAPLPPVALSAADPQEESLRVSRQGA